VDDFLQRRPVLAAIAVILALAVWISVTNQSDPMVDRTFSDVGVEAMGTSTGKVVISPKFVTVTVTGPRSVIGTLRASALSVQADTAGVGPGKSRVNLILKAPPGVGLVDLTPDHATVIQNP